MNQHIASEMYSQAKIIMLLSSNPYVAFWDVSSTDEIQDIRKIMNGWQHM